MAVPDEQMHMLVPGQIIEGQQLDLQGHAVRVTVIRGGRSKNGFVYQEAALRKIAELLEGAHAYADHARSEIDQQTRSIRDIVGFYHDAQYSAEDGGHVDATLHILETAGWLWSLIREACQLGRPELVGLSIDILGQWQNASEAETSSQTRQTSEATKLPTRLVTRVLALNSCDIVTHPSAGGAFKRILHHACQNPSDTTSPLATEGNRSMTDNHDSSSDNEHLPTKTPPTEQTTDLHIQEQAQVRNLLHELRTEQAQLHLERRLLETTLPDPVKETIRARYQGRIFEQSELEQEIKTQQELLAALSASGLIRGHRYEKTAVSGMISEAEKIQAAFDRLFDLEVEARLGAIRPFHSIREAYTRVTGDATVSGLSEQSRLGQIRVSEEAPISRVSEADTTTASFSYLLGTSMNKRLLQDYQAWPAEWMRFVTIAPLRDFKQQSRVRLGAFGSLPIVAEDTPYTAVSMTDSAATYVPQKRGNLVTISREVIVNDDLQAIKQIPTKLAVAAAYTLAEFVYSFLSSNPTIYDSSALFTSGAPHNNLGASALSTSAMQSGVTAMREQSNYAGKRIGLRPRFLVVPPEMEWTSMVITKSANIPGSNNNDINPMLGYVTPVVAAQLTSTTQWFLVADPREVDTIEIGFVGGQVNPTLFIQDQPLFGLNFTQDAISYKIRHEYGGAVVDYRGLYRGI